MKTGCTVKISCRLIILFICMISFCKVSFAQKKDAESTKQATKTANSFTYKIINGNKGTYGYDVFADGKLLVHQPSIPALPGNDGFKTQTSAEKVAKLVIQKMQKGEMPPTVTVDELKKLKAI